MKNQHQEEPPPPIFKTWNQMYAFVLILHFVLLSVFYYLTKIYS
ncbi:MAG: hypothetical protein AB8H03_12665 [Saprospiraceae bacterium]